ncbi:MAG: hypothetical protein IKG76_03450 [Firmicutes bacterium]|nr:hypothetical protein [Bacillota bacterium]
MKMKGSKGISLLLVLSLLLTACGGGGGSAKATTLSPENTSGVSNGVTVDVGDFVLDGDAELSVAKGETEDHSDDGYKIDVYDIKLGDMHELGDYITIRIPYDTTYCKEGQDPAKCVGAKYMNEETGEWEDVLFEVDAEKQELVIYTDHLSYYGALYVEDEGKRNALVTEVLNSPLTMDKATTLDFARRIAADDASVKKDLNAYVDEASDMLFDYADRLDNAINIAMLGDTSEIPKWLDTSIPDTNQTLFSALGYIATATNLLRVARDEMKGGADKAAVLNLIRDVGSKVTTYWADAFTTVGSGALSVGMGGVLIIDKMLTAFAEEAQATKMEDIAYVYHHYNEGFSATWAHKTMKPKDWREKVLQVLEKHPDDPEVAVSALEAGFRKYASEFFDLSADQMAEVASDVPNVTVKRIPNFTEAEKEQLIDQYVAHLKDATMPAVLTSAENYMIRKAEEAQLAAVNAIKDYYNSKISISMQEPIPEGGTSAFKDYKFRFAPLNETAPKSNWTGKWPESGSVKTSATLIGFMTAGYPHTVEFFKPDADMDNDKPEFTVPFVISVPAINITVGALYPTLEEICGTYSDAVITILDVGPPEVVEALKKGGEEGEEGCDIDLEAIIGQSQSMPFTLTQTGPNTAIFTSASMEEEGEAIATKDLVYDPMTGILQWNEPLVTEEASITMSFNCEYKDETKKAVVLDGKLTETLGSGEIMGESVDFDGTGLYVTAGIKGEKPLE